MPQTHGFQAACLSEGSLKNTGRCFQAALPFGQPEKTPHIEMCGVRVGATGLFGGGLGRRGFFFNGFFGCGGFVGCFTGGFAGGGLGCRRFR